MARKGKYKITQNYIIVPRTILDKLKNQEISKPEFCLIAFIEHLDTFGKGCYASNETLGSFVGGTLPQHISDTVNRLAKLGVIKIRWKKLNGRGRPKRFLYVIKDDISSDPAIT